VRTLRRPRPGLLCDRRGFGLIELLIAMNLMAIGILGLFAMFQAGIVQIRRAGTVSTAAALAEAEMENYRAIPYGSIGLPEEDLDAIPPSDPYKTDGAYAAGSLVVLPVCGAPPCTTSTPVQAKTGADGRQYRVDTFMSWQTPANGRNLKLVTIVIRDAAAPARMWARVVSAFDESTGT